MALATNRLTPPLVLKARTAADLMTADPKSVRHEATVTEAAAFLTGRGFSAAPVIDEAGRPIGVVSRTDLLRRQRGQAVRIACVPGAGTEVVEFDDNTPVREVMTPVMFCVSLDTPASAVVERLLALDVRRLFVVDDDGILVGVVSSFDVLRSLRPGGEGPRKARSPTACGGETETEHDQLAGFDSHL